MAVLAEVGCHTIRGVDSQPHAVRIRCTRNNSTSSGVLAFTLGTETRQQLADKLMLDILAWCPTCKNSI